MKRAIIYTRFSPRRNAEESESCEVQQAYCEQHAQKQGYAVGAVLHDKAVSGSDEFRPKLWSAIDKLDKGGVLLVYKRDRLARNVYLSEHIRRSVEKKGATIEAVTGDVSGDSIEAQMIRQVLAVMAEYERRLTGQRTSFAMLHHQRNGRRMGRFAPYGWRVDPADEKRLMPVNSEQVAVDRIAELRAQGRTFPEIVRELNTEMADVSRVGRWSVAQVQKIAKRV